MRYAVARFEEHQRDTAYRIYLCECSRMIVKSIGGVELPSVESILSPQKVDNRTGDEIALDVIKRLGLEVVKE